MHEHLKDFTAAEGVVFIGRAQEKNTVFRTEKRRHPDGSTVSVDRENHRGDQPILFLLRGQRFRAVLPEILFLFPVHRANSASTETIGRSARPRRQGSDSPRWTTRSPPWTTPAALQEICDRLGPVQIQALLDKWLAILPNPFTEADTDAGYRYQLSILQAEFSLTQMLDNPVSGRVFFEQVIRDNLDIGRPDQVSLIFDRRIDPPRPVPNAGPVPDPGHHRRRHPEPARGLQKHHDQAIPQGRSCPENRNHHQRQRGLRGSGKVWRICPPCGRSASAANRRLLRVQRLDHDPITGIHVLHTVTDPITTENGTRVPGLRLGQQRSHALLTALPMFRLQPRRVHQPRPPPLIAELRGLPHRQPSPSGR